MLLAFFANFLAEATASAFTVEHKHEDWHEISVERGGFRFSFSDRNGAGRIKILQPEEESGPSITSASELSNLIAALREMQSGLASSNLTARKSGLKMSSPGEKGSASSERVESRRQEWDEAVVTRGKVRVSYSTRDGWLSVRGDRAEPSFKLKALPILIAGLSELQDRLIRARLVK